MQTLTQISSRAWEHPADRAALNTLRAIPGFDEVVRKVASFFGERGIPVILSRPKGGAAHGDGEWIDKEDLLNYYQAVKAYVQEVATA